MVYRKLLAALSSAYSRDTPGKKCFAKTIDPFVSIPIPAITASYQVLATDYKYWTVEYDCVNGPFGRHSKSVNYWRQTLRLFKLNLNCPRDKWHGGKHVFLSCSLSDDLDPPPVSQRVRDPRGVPSHPPGQHQRPVQVPHELGTEKLPGLKERRSLSRKAEKKKTA